MSVVSILDLAHSQVCPNWENYSQYGLIFGSFADRSMFLIEGGNVIIET